MLFQMLKPALLPLLWVLAIGQARPDPSAIILKAQALADGGQLPQAEQLLESALRDSPNNPDLRFSLGMVYLRERNWEIAIENYQISLKENPRQVRTLFYLGEAYFMNSDFERACASLVEAVKVAPEDAQVRQKYGEYLSSRLASRSEGLRQLQKARQLDPHLPRVDFDIGKAQFDLTDFRSAAESLESELKARKDDGEAAFFLAEAEAKLGNWQKAQTAYEYALAHGNAEAPAYYGLGRARVELEEYSSAVAPLQKALGLRPSLIEAHFQLGKAYQRLGRRDEARRETKLFAAMNGRIDTSQESRGAELEDAWKRVKPLLAANQEMQALEYLAKLPEVDRANPAHAYYLLGEMYFSLGRREDAKRELLAARDRSPDDPRIAAYLGMVQLASDQIDAAEQSLHAALALDAAEPLALIGMGGIRYRQQRWGDAIPYFEHSRTADPNTLLLLCDAYFRVGKREEGLLTAEIVRAFGVDQPTVLDSLHQLLKQYEESKTRP